MNPWLLLIVAVIVVVWGFLRRRPRRGRQEDRGMSMPRIDGFQVTSPLHPRMTRGCVFDLGLQYGRGFRRKDGPALPHGPDCQCRTAHFAFSGTEVFNGSLRKLGELRCSVPGFPQEACKPLLDALKRVNAEPVPDTLTGYLERIGPMEGFAPEHQAPVRRFLEDRFAYLRGAAAAAQGASIPESNTVSDAESKPRAAPANQPTDGA
jgi:hypothetical protein